MATNLPRLSFSSFFVVSPFYEYYNGIFLGPEFSCVVYRKDDRQRIFLKPLFFQLPVISYHIIKSARLALCFTRSEYINCMCRLQPRVPGDLERRFRIVHVRSPDNNSTRHQRRSVSMLREYHTADAPYKLPFYYHCYYY